MLMLPWEESESLGRRLSNLPHRHFPGRPALKQILNEIFHSMRSAGRTPDADYRSDQLVRGSSTINCSYRYKKLIGHR